MTSVVLLYFSSCNHLKFFSLETSLRFFSLMFIIYSEGHSTKYNKSQLRRSKITPVELLFIFIRILNESRSFQYFLFRILIYWTQKNILHSCCVRVKSFHFAFFYSSYEMLCHHHKYTFFAPPSVFKYSQRTFVVVITRRDKIYFLE